LSNSRYSYIRGGGSGKLMKTTVISSLLLLSIFCCVVQAQEDGQDFFDLSLDELLKVRVNQPAVLTKTSIQTVPASVTTITMDDIRHSAARSMNELLEIYVPGLQYINHRWGFSHLGARGIMSDRDDKYLLLVNGRTMNERTVVGAITERDLNILGDIHHIDIIRGAGSATYGVGAVAMVINIVTLDDQTFQGHELITKVGVGEDYESLEYKWGKNFGPNSGLFTYFGISDFRGASFRDAPIRYSTSGIDKEGGFTAAETDVNIDIGNDKRQHRDLPKLKAHLSWRLHGLDIWARYSRGGEQKPPALGATFLPPLGNDSLLVGDPIQLGSQQITLMTSYHQTPSENWSLNYALSYDIVDYERLIGKSGVETFREDEVLARLLASWESGGDHGFAIGLEANHEKFGLDSPGFPDEASNIPGFIDNPNGWSTNTTSLFFEHQWRLSDQWTSFFSGRLDDHSYTQVLFSPRLSQIWLADGKNGEETLRLLKR